jgi:phosphoenolpyruvate-protein phosphotransferase (PTS system enzyme I)
MTTRKRPEPGEGFRGLGVSPGIAVAPAMVLEGPAVTPARCDLRPDQVPAEVVRFRSAVRTAWRQLRGLRDRVRTEAGEPCARIFQAQILILKDRSFLKEAVQMIRRDRINTEWAVHAILGRYTRIFAQVASEDLRDRGSDIQDVEARLMAILSGSRSPDDLGALRDDVILVAAVLAPSDAAGLDRSHVVGLAIDSGGPTSHTAVIASAMGVPAVAGLRGLSARVRTGEMLALDGSSGQVLRNPSPEEVQSWLACQAREADRQKQFEALRHEPATTEDGLRITLRANIELPEEIPGALRQGAEGIGLYRSEFLYLRSAPRPPDEETQFASYRALVEQSAPHEVVIRTLDLGGEGGVLTPGSIPEASPVLGMRGVRLGLRHPDLFRIQIRAILRAGVRGRVRILLPMVSSLEEVRQARALMEESRRDLLREGVAVGELPLGVMIEVPAAALIADRLALEVDFFSIGTNDLIQYTLAIDRANLAVSYLYRPLHPAILLLIRRVVDAAARRGLRVAVCGEMASDPVCAVALIGLGITELSMSPAAIPSVKQVIRGLSSRQVRSIIDDALERSTAAEIEESIRERVLSLVAPRYAPSHAGAGS